jgi:hypothetical protein
MLSFSALLACQSRASESVPTPPAIELLDDHGVLNGELRPSHPCRARIGPIEMQIGGPPLVAQLGATRLTGSSDDHGTTLASDGQMLVRMLPSADGRGVDVFDPTGAALVRFDSDGSGATIRSAGRDVLHRVEPRGDQLVLDNGAQAVRGTHDALLAALLVDPELLPEVRMLAACQRAWGGK